MCLTLLIYSDYICYTMPYFVISEFFNVKSQSLLSNFFNKMVLLNELSNSLVCRSSLTQSSEFLYHTIGIGGELVATLLVMLFTGWCCVHKVKR